MTSSSSDKDSNDLTDPRFLVITSIFFLYGVFIILVLFFSRGTSFWSGLWSCLKEWALAGLNLELRGPRRVAFPRQSHFKDIGVQAKSIRAC